MIASALQGFFGAKGQVAFGVILTLIALGLWIFYTFFSAPDVRTVFHISMLFGVAATYAIIATGLGYRATERVEDVVVEQAKDVDVEHADRVDVNMTSEKGGKGR